MNGRASLRFLALAFFFNPVTGLTVSFGQLKRFYQGAIFECAKNLPNYCSLGSVTDASFQAHPTMVQLLSTVQLPIHPSC
jgi:hypothetical protein